MKGKNHNNQKVIVKQYSNGLLPKIPYLIIVLYAVFLAIGRFYHELWRDELEIYGVIAYGDGIKNCIAEYTYIFYFLLMKVFLWINESQAMYQFYHYIIIVSAIFLLNKYSPFNLFEKFFLTFSYFLFFEYGIISRYYGFLVLLVFVIMFLLSRKKVNYYLIMIPFIILANHSINSFIFALPIFLFIINNLFKNFKNKTLTKNIIIFYVFLCFCIAAIGLIYITHTFENKIQFATLAKAPYFMTIRSIWNSFVPLPEFTNHANFWNSNIFYFPSVYPANYDINSFKTTQNYTLAILSLLIFVIILIKFSKKPIVFWVFLCNCIILLIFLHVAKIYYVRHQGLLFIAFVYSYWLFHIADEKNYIPVLNKVKLDALSRLRIGLLFKPMITLFLVLQFVPASYAFYKELKYKFTLSHDAAIFIKNNNLVKGHIIVGYNDYATQAIAINLKEKMYFPQSETYSYNWSPFDINHITNMPITDVYKACSNFTEKQNKKVLLILNFPIIGSDKKEISSTIYQNTAYVLIKSFKGDIIQTDEQFWLYEVTKLNLNDAMNLDFDNAESYNNLGVSYWKSQQYDKAIEVFEKAVKIAPHDIKTISNFVSVCNNLAISSNDAKDKAKYYELALKYCDDVYKLNPDIPMVNLVLGIIYAQYKIDFNKSVYYLNKTINLTPNDIAAYQNLGAVYYDLKQYDNAIEVFEKALKIAPQDKTVLNYLEMAYKITGKTGGK